MDKTDKMDKVDKRSGHNSEGVEQLITVLRIESAMTAKRLTEIDKVDKIGEMVEIVEIGAQIPSVETQCLRLHDAAAASSLTLEGLPTLQGLAAAPAVLCSTLFRSGTASFPQTFEVLETSKVYACGNSCGLLIYMVCSPPSGTKVGGCIASPHSASSMRGYSYSPPSETYGNSQNIHPLPPPAGDIRTSPRAPERKPRASLFTTFIIFSGVHESYDLRGETTKQSGAWHHAKALITHHFFQNIHPLPPPAGDIRTSPRAPHESPARQFLRSYGLFFSESRPQDFLGVSERSERCLQRCAELSERSERHLQGCGGASERSERRLQDCGELSETSDDFLQRCGWIFDGKEPLRRRFFTLLVKKRKL